MRPYTVEVTWRVPEYTHLTVQADSPAQAIKVALAEAYPDPPGNTLPLPQTPERHLETAVEAAVAHVRKGSSAPRELRNLLAAFDAWREAR
jgi:hypothetical protein